MVMGDFNSTWAVPLSAREPERLVGAGFRCWVAGMTTGDMTIWQDTRAAYCAALGEEQLVPVVRELASFVRAVQSSADRLIAVNPPGCRGFCRDECLAISIVAACQHDVRPSLCASAVALIGSDDIGDTLACAQAYAGALWAANQILAKESVCPATCSWRLTARRLS